MERLKDGYYGNPDMKITAEVEQDFAIYTSDLSICPAVIVKKESSM